MYGNLLKLLLKQGTQRTECGFHIFLLHNKKRSPKIRAGAALRLGERRYTT